MKEKGGVKIDQNGVRFPCCIYEVTDSVKIYRSLALEQMKNYGEKTVLEDGTVLHNNYDTEGWDGGDRKLLRCRKCGGLFFCLYYYDYNMYDGYYSCNDWIPVRTEEEADLLNILIDGNGGFRSVTERYLHRSDWTYKWVGTGDPVDCDPEELRKLIRERYADTDPELLEKLIRTAGTEHAPEKNPWVKPEEKEPDPEEEKPEPEEEKSYRYLANFSWDPPTLIRLGSYERMEADKLVYPGVWKDTPRLNDIRVGLGDVLDYDDVTEEEAMKILERNKAYYEQIAAKQESNFRHGAER